MMTMMIMMVKIKRMQINEIEQMMWSKKNVMSRKLDALLGLEGGTHKKK